MNNSAKNNIKRSFLNLSTTVPMHRITVKSIVQMAHINRSTFYAYYDNTESLMDEIENDLWDKIQVFGRIDLEARKEELHNIYHDKELFRLFMGKNGDPSFINKLSKVIENNWENMGITDDLAIPKSYAVSAVSGIFSEVFLSWARGGFRETPDELGIILGVLVDGIPERLFSKNR